MQEFSLKCFGIGDGWPSERNHSAFLYRLGEQNLLIDCGEPISQSLHRAGVESNTLDSIFLSHLHFDHVGGFFMLMQGLWLQQRTKDLRVYLPPDGITPVRQMLEAGYIFEELLPFRLRFEGLRARESVEIGPVRVTPIPTTHLDSLRERFQGSHPQAFAAFAFLIEAGGRRIVHSADLGAADDLARVLQEPLDLVVCELAHVDPIKLFRLLKGRVIRRVVLVHLSTRQCKHVQELRSLAETHLGSTAISFPRDGDELVF